MPDPQGPVWHDLIPPVDVGIVPDMIDHTNALVQSFLDQNKAWAQEAIDSTLTTINELKDAHFPEELPNPPDVPSVAVSGSVAVSPTIPDPNLGAVVARDMPDFSSDPVTIDPSAGAPPVYVPVISGLTIPEAPLFTVPGELTPPGLDLTFVTPDTPQPDYGLPPTLLDLPVYIPPILPIFGDTAPTFSELPPTPFIQWQEPVYTSAIKDAVAAVLTEMLATGTGLPEEIERAIWERDRDREYNAALKLTREAIERWSARGFERPPGQLNEELYAIEDDAQAKINSAARDIAIKQADLVIGNRQFAVQHGISYEQVFTALFMQIVDRNFQIAKFTVETTIQIYNMQIAAFNVQQAVFGQKIELYRVEVEAAFANIRAFEAEIKAKAETNTALVQQFNGRVQAFGAEVSAYTATVSAAVEKANLQKTKVDLFRAQIEAQVAQLSVLREQYSAYTARVQGEVAKGSLEESNARVFGTKTQAWATQMETAFKKADVQIQTQRLTLDWDVAQLNRITQDVAQQLQLVQAKATVYEARVRESVAIADAERANRVAELQGTVELSRLGVAKYTALLEQWRARAAQVTAFAQINSEALKAAGQIAATLSAGAMAGTHVSAGVSAGASSTQGLSNQRSEGKTFNQNTQDSVQVQFSHPYKPI